MDSSSLRGAAVEDISNELLNFGSGYRITGQPY